MTTPTIIAMPSPSTAGNANGVVYIHRSNVLHALSATGIVALMERRFAKWQLPDYILFEPEPPHTATGKISKLDLRQRLAERGHALPARYGLARRSPGNKSAGMDADFRGFHRESENFTLKNLGKISRLQI